MNLGNVYTTGPSLDAWVALTDLYGDDMLTPVHLGQVLNVCGTEAALYCLKCADDALIRRVMARWVLGATALPAEPPEAMLHVLRRLAAGPVAGLPTSKETLDLTCSVAWGYFERLAPKAYDRLRGLFTSNAEAIREVEFARCSAWVTGRSPAYRLFNVYAATDKPKAHAILREVIA